MISIEVTTRGIPARVARMREVKAGLFDAMAVATLEGVDLMVAAIKGFTPVMVENRGGSDRFPGELRESISGTTEETATGAFRGKAFTNVEWAPFVEWGTLEHGPARHMFSLGRSAARPLIKANFENIVRVVTGG